MQMVALPTVIIGNMEPYIPYLDKIGHGVLWVSVILSITSGIEYYLGYMKNRKV
ncbi:hypothetical protein D3C87_1778530 [compost metagenome]